MPKNDRALRYARKAIQSIQKDIGFDEPILPRRFRTTVLTDIYDTTKDAAGHTTSAMTLKHYMKGRPQNLNAAKTVSMLYGLPGSSAM